MKIYTRTGDDGTTGLIGGGRVRKSDPRIECYGTVDELNSHLGLAAVVAPVEIRAVLDHVMHDLFVVGSHLAAPEAPPASQWLPPLDEQMVSRLEMQIDQHTARLDPLRHFILPGGGECAARLHVARTVCRRAERLLVDFSLDRPVPGLLLTYLNRLSDWLFVAARLANHLEGVPDVPWLPRKTEER
jgi:cob(I)alamin adenosyltransferase